MENNNSTDYRDDDTNENLSQHDREEETISKAEKTQIIHDILHSVSGTYNIVCGIIQLLREQKELKLSQIIKHEHFSHWKRLITNKGWFIILIQMEKDGLVSFDAETEVVSL